MNEMDMPAEIGASAGDEVVETASPREARLSKKPDWELPTMEDVSEQVMAQPYIRFT